jgi:hypothetical protein
MSVDDTSNGEQKIRRPLRHVFDDASIECPNDFIVTAIMTVRTKEKEFAPNVVFSRERLRQDESPGTYVARQLVELAKNLKQFRLHGRQEITIRGRTAHRISCGWAGSQGPIEQQVTIFVKGNEALTFTSTLPKKKAAELLPLFEQIVGSVEIEEGEA